uniref:EF-hand domain-containing protein n=1 Tax=Accipiter nisus TaxID=211598 RepID=A0A8B9MG16_9AVES
MAMRSLGYMPSEVELAIIMQRLDMDGDGQVDFDEFMTILGPKLVSSEGRDGFLGNTIDSIFWQVSGHFFKCDFSQLSIASTTDLLRSTRCFAKHECLCKHYWGPSCHVLCK